MSVRVHVATIMTLLCLTEPVINGAFATDLLQSGATTVHDEDADRVRLKQEANDLAVQAFEHYEQLRYEPALKLLKQAETLLLRLYPPDRTEAKGSNLI